MKRTFEAFTRISPIVLVVLAYAVPIGAICGGIEPGTLLDALELVAVGLPAIVILVSISHIASHKRSAEGILSLVLISPLVYILWVLATFHRRPPAQTSFNAQGMSLRSVQPPIEIGSL